MFNWCIKNEQKLYINRTKLIWKFVIFINVIWQAKRNRIFAGIHVGSTKYAHKMIGLGYNFVSILSDGKIMSQAIENILKEMKEDSIEKKSSIYWNLS